MQELARPHLQRWLGDRLLVGHPPSRTTSTARAEDQGILKLSSVLSSDQPHVFANGEATGRAPSLYICTYNEGFLDHRGLGGRPHFGLLRRHVQRTRA